MCGGCLSNGRSSTSKITSRGSIDQQLQRTSGSNLLTLCRSSDSADGVSHFLGEGSTLASLPVPAEAAARALAKAASLFFPHDFSKSATLGAATSSAPKPHGQRSHRGLQAAAATASPSRPPAAAASPILVHDGPCARNTALVLDLSLVHLFQRRASGDSAQKCRTGRGCVASRRRWGRRGLGCGRGSGRLCPRGLGLLPCRLPARSVVEVALCPGEGGAGRVSEGVEASGRAGRGGRALYSPLLCQSGTRTSCRTEATFVCTAPKTQLVGIYRV